MLQFVVTHHAENTNEQAGNTENTRTQTLPIFLRLHTSDASAQLPLHRKSPPAPTTAQPGSLVGIITEKGHVDSPSGNTLCVQHASAYLTPDATRKNEQAIVNFVGMEWCAHRRRPAHGTQGAAKHQAVITRAGEDALSVQRTDITFRQEAPTPSLWSGATTLSFNLCSTRPSAFNDAPWQNARGLSLHRQRERAPCVSAAKPRLPCQNTSSVQDHNDHWSMSNAI